MSSRADYEAVVRGIGFISASLLAGGADEESVARLAVAARNSLKEQYRAGLPAPILDAIHARNRKLYGNALGPTAEQQFERYGSWRAVIDAAARPANLA
ncbi:MAG: hemagglutinin [Sphingomonas sp.]|nr:hemagglutinin [Sphingomonas sp.]